LGSKWFGSTTFGKRWYSSFGGEQGICSEADDGKYYIPSGHYSEAGKGPPRYDEGMDDIAITILRRSRQHEAVYYTNAGVGLPVAVSCA
jgi:hypothetical protein